MALVSLAGLTVAALAGTGAMFYQPIMQRATTLGFTRPRYITNMHPNEVFLIENTLECEDMHYHKQSKNIFAVCAHRNSPTNKQEWFPGFPQLAHPEKAHRGAIFRFDPKNLTAGAEQLALREFYGPFVTHGMDIFPDPGHESDIVWIHAVNHAVDPDWTPESGRPVEDAYRPKIETFKYVFPQHGAVHVRTVEHPLIRTPNDIFATSPTDFYVSNDHFYLSGFMRQLEDFATPDLAPWTDVVHVHMENDPKDDQGGVVRVTQALTGLHNANGLGHASRWRKDDVLIADATGGVLSRARRTKPRSKYDYSLEVFDKIQLDSTIDNPFWYEDVYATPGKNASGYIIAGLPQAYKALDAARNPGDAPIPTYVWHVTPPADATAEVLEKHDLWEKKLIFVDNGKKVRGGSIAVLVPINPKENNGLKQGWLSISGFSTTNVAVVKVDL